MYTNFINYIYSILYTYIEFCIYKMLYIAKYNNIINNDILFI